jgi:alpha-L-fucosidase
LAWKDQSILIPNIDKKVKSAKLLSDMSNIKFSESKEGIILTIPYEKRKPLETIIVLEF